MGDEEPVTQQTSADSPEQDTGTQAEPETTVEGGGLQPDVAPAAPPKYKPVAPGEAGVQSEAAPAAPPKYKPVAPGKGGVKREAAPAPEPKYKP